MANIEIRKATGTWVVRAGGAVLAESKNALVLSEPGHGDVVYFPRNDIAMAFLDATDLVTHCPKKGDASYFSIVTKSQTLENVGWSYESPIEAAARIKEHIAFTPGDYLAVERV
ncbi:MAG: DUF427 domain-containing protein [Roseovarius sp.]|nr:DUF427 domain-containing protein [Roseovarius sp.]